MSDKVSDERLRWISRWCVGEEGNMARELLARRAQDKASDAAREALCYITGRAFRRGAPAEMDDFARRRIDEWRALDDALKAGAEGGASHAECGSGLSGSASRSSPDPRPTAPSAPATFFHPPVAASADTAGGALTANVELMTDEALDASYVKGGPTHAALLRDREARKLIEHRLTRERDEARYTNAKLTADAYKTAAVSPERIRAGEACVAFVRGGGFTAHNGVPRGRLASANEAIEALDAAESGKGDPGLNVFIRARSELLYWLDAMVTPAASSERVVAALDSWLRARGMTEGAT